jgi:hypothetical protein
MMLRRRLPPLADRLFHQVLELAHPDTVHKRPPSGRTEVQHGRVWILGIAYGDEIVLVRHLDARS